MTETVRCPICKHVIPAGAQAPRPFCSARCRAIDLGSWLDGQYRLSSPVEEDEDETVPCSQPDEGEGKS